MTNERHGAGDDLREWVVASLRRWAELYGEPPRWDDWRVRRPDWPTSNDACRAFGTLGAAVEAAGLEPRQRGSLAYKDAVRAEISDAIREWTRLHGQPPRQIDWDPHRARSRGKPELAERYLAGDWPHAERVKRLFGSWAAAIEAATGVRPPPYRRSR